MTVNDSAITCTVQTHPAGSVRVSVHVAGKGRAAYENDSTVCFRYLLTLTDIQPASGSTEGGTQVTIRGHGFLPTSEAMTSFTEPPLSSVAWLVNGFGQPVLPPLTSLCPDIAAELVNFTNTLSDERHLQQTPLDGYDYENTILQVLGNSDALQMMIARLYRGFPIRVFIGSAPCVVTQATLDELVCTTTRHDDGIVNITVTVLGETLSYEAGYSYDVDLTPSIFSISPDSGPVYGGTNLTIEGKALQTTTSVLIGDARCQVISQTSTEVVCVTSSHAPAFLPVLVSTSQGVARVAMEGSGDFLTPLEELFFFEYELEVNSVGPLQGSLNGGLLLTIEGRGFHPSLTSVLIGDRSATIISVEEEIVQCLTPPPTVTHTLTLLDEGYSVGEFFLTNSTLKG